MSPYAALTTVVDAVLGMATRRTYRNLDRIPRTGPVIVVSNHVSISDPLVLVCALRRAGRRASFLVKADVFTWPVVGTLIRRTGQLPVRRGADPRATLEPALRALANGWVVALYPEGGITTEPDYRPLPQARTGAVRLALAADCPILPVAQWGAHKLVTREHTSSLTRPLRWLGRLRPGRVPRRPRVDLSVGEAITVGELLAAAGGSADGDPGDLGAATDLVMRRIKVLLTEIAADDLPDLIS